MRAPGIGDAGETLKAVAETAQSGSRLRLANPAIEAAQKLVTRRNFSRTGFPSAVVSTAATNGVLPGAPRPRFPPWRSPPR